MAVEARKAMRPALWVALRAGGFAAMVVTVCWSLFATILGLFCYYLRSLLTLVLLEALPFWLSRYVCMYVCMYVCTYMLRLT